MKAGKLKVGVVGLKVGNSHVTDYLASPDVAEVVLCDINENTLKTVGERHGIGKRYGSFTDMLARETPDAVSIAAPNKMHMPLTIQALEAGCHVLCEKPMARTAAEAADMIDAARKHRRKLMINFNQRFEPHHRAMKSIIESGRLGDIYFVRTTWHRRRGVPRWYTLTRDVCGGGGLIDLGVHRLDLAMWLCGYPQPEWVLGRAFSKVEIQEDPSFELDDMAVAMIRMKGGIMLELEASWAGHRESEEMKTRIYGTKGGLLLRTVPSDPASSKRQLYTEFDGKLVNVDLAEGEFGNAPLSPRMSIRQAFIDSILGDTEVPCTPEQGLTINRILDAVYASEAAGGPVELRSPADAGSGGR